MNKIAVPAPVVAAPIVNATCRIKDAVFAAGRVIIAAHAIRPSTDVIHGDVIVLGTPSSIPALLPTLEDNVPIHTEFDRVVLTGWNGRKRDKNARKTFLDTHDPDGAEMVKYAVLTRHHYRLRQTITAITANDELAVDSVVAFLTNEETILALACELRCRGEFPDHFQALFCVRLLRGARYACATEIVTAIDLTKQ